jgi:hypothetical protein
MVEVSNTQNTTIVLPVPIELLAGGGALAAQGGQAAINAAANAAAQLAAKKSGELPAGAPEKLPTTAELAKILDEKHGK